MGSSEPGLPKEESLTQAVARVKSTCELCGYSLIGLPSQHSCPECGLEYDPDSRVIILGGRKRDAQNALGALFLAVLILTQVSSRVSSVAEVLPCATIVLVFFLLYSWRWFGKVGVKQRLFIDRQGIRFEHSELPRTVITWAVFGEARVSWITGRFRVIGRDGRTLIGCRYYHLGTLGLVRHCVAEINRLAHAYAAV